jgi:hypothetical protein
MRDRISVHENEQNFSSWSSWLQARLIAHLNEQNETGGKQMQRTQYEGSCTNFFSSNWSSIVTIDDRGGYDKKHGEANQVVGAAVWEISLIDKLCGARPGREHNLLNQINRTGPGGQEETQKLQMVTSVTHTWKLIASEASTSAFDRKK